MTDPFADAFSKLGAQAREAAASSVSAELHAHARARLLAATEGLPRDGVRVQRRRWLIGGGLCAAAAACALFFVTRDTRGLRYEVRGAERVAVNYIDAARDQPAEVHFSDGSAIEARPGARLRIDETRKDGARVFIEHGVAQAHVVHAAHMHWNFVAGPFDVRVVGTRFRLGWDPRSEEIDLALYEGAVEVDSPIGTSRCVVRAGQRFHASLSTGALSLRQLDEPQTEAARPEAQTPQATQEPAAAKSQRASAPAAVVAKSEPQQTHARVDTAKRESAPEASWPELVLRGEFQAVVGAATARGILVSLSASSDVELRALADAARYSDHGELAKRALTSLRERFPHAAASAPAPFLLGRIYEAEAQPERAERWYRVYLEENARGEFAADALAGRMRSVAAREGNRAAEALALEYLTRYPNGIHAAAAKRIAHP